MQNAYTHGVLFNRSSPRGELGMPNSKGSPVYLVRVRCRRTWYIPGSNYDRFEYLRPDGGITPAASANLEVGNTTRQFPELFSSSGYDIFIFSEISNPSDFPCFFVGVWGAAFRVII